jgi:uncharacterized protein YycO
VTDRWNPISAAIRFSTRSEFSHAEFIDTEAGVTFGSRSHGGVMERPCSIDHYTRVEQFTANSSHAEEAMRAAYAWARTQAGKRYDYSAITGIAFNRDWRDEARWFCSELVAAAFENVGFPLLSTRPSDKVYRITPRDLLLSRSLVFLEGKGLDV